jgi:hypothetical protein
MLNPIDIMSFYKVVGWFDGQNISVKLWRARFNPFYQHMLCGVCIFYIFYTCV